MLPFLACGGGELYGEYVVTMMLPFLESGRGVCMGNTLSLCYHSLQVIGVFYGEYIVSILPLLEWGILWRICCLCYHFWQLVGRILC